MPRMLGNAPTGVLIRHDGRQRRCFCIECRVLPTHGQARAREKRVLAIEVLGDER